MKRALNYDPVKDAKDTRRVIESKMPGYWQVIQNNPEHHANLAAVMMVKAPHLQGEIIRESHMNLCHAHWYKTKGVYTFDPTLKKALLSTSFDEIQDTVFRYLPEACVYIAVNEEVDGKYMYGGFVFSRSRENATDLIVLSVRDSGDSDHPYFYDTVATPILHNRPLKFLERAELAKSQMDEVRKSELGGKYFKSRLRPMHERLLILASYLCSVDPDIRNPKEPRNKPNRHVKNTGSVRQWEVGYRFGATFRKQLAEAEQANTRHNGDDRNRPRVHVRRAHWHSYWTGPKGTEQKRVVKWLPPVIVNGTSDDLPATIWKQQAD